jgi:hypothetical protein
VLDDDEEDPEADYMPTDEESEDESEDESDQSDHETPPMTPTSPTVSFDQGERGHTN